MTRRFDAIVIGAGYGGVTAAAVLASRGLRVLIVDKNTRPGGKAMRAVRNGVVHDLWPIAGGPTRGSRFGDLVRLLSKGERSRNSEIPPFPPLAKGGGGGFGDGSGEGMILEPDPAAEFIYLAPDGSKRSVVVPARPIRNPLARLRIASPFGVRPWQLGGVLAMEAVSAAMPDWALDRLDRVSMLDWLRRFRLPPVIHDWTASLMNLFFVVPVDRLPASEAIRTLREVSVGGAGRYHKGGYGIVAEEAVRFVESRGGQWLGGTRVERIIRKGGAVCGVSTGRGEFDAPVVVSNAGIQPTVLRLAGERAFSGEYVSKVRKLVPSWAFVGVRYDLDAPVFKVPMTVVFSRESWWDSKRFDQAEKGHWPDKPLLFVTVPSLYDPELCSGRARQVALIGVLCSPDPKSPMNGVAISKAQGMTARMWPEIERHVIRRQTFGAAQVSATTRDAVLPGQGGECIGLGQMIGQCGRSKPNPRSPLKGLYFVGCDAGGRGIGTTQAVDSGFNVAEMVLKDMGRGKIPPRPPLLKGGTGGFPGG